MPLRVEERNGHLWITGYVGGRRIRKSAGTRNRRLAEEKAAILEAGEYRAALHGRPPARYRFAEAVASYLEHGGPHAPATKAQALRLLLFFGPEAYADDIDQREIDRACTALLRPNPSPATRLRHIVSPVRAILSHGAKRRMCAVPVFDRGRASPSRTEWLSPAEFDRLVAVAAPHLVPLLTFLAGTGARLSEALRLDWRDVDLTHARAKLRDTKNGADRDVDLCHRVLAALRFDPREKRRRGAERLLTGRVFLTRAGRAYAERKVQGGGQIKTAWAAALTRAGINKPITPHGLRHTWASWHYAEHKDLLLLQRDGGWSGVALVERYAHLIPATMAEGITAWRATDQLKPQAQVTIKKNAANSKA